MATNGDYKYIWFANPVYEDDYGNKSIVGYNNLQKLYALYVPATAESDYTLYGNNVTNVLKFEVKKPFNYSSNGGDGVYLSEPTVGKDGYYKNPEYIAKPIRNHRNIYLFDGVKQVY